MVGVHVDGHIHSPTHYELKQGTPDFELMLTLEERLESLEDRETWLQAGTCACTT